MRSKYTLYFKEIIDKLDTLQQVVELKLESGNNVIQKVDKSEVLVKETDDKTNTLNEEIISEVASLQRNLESNIVASESTEVIQILGQNEQVSALEESNDNLLSIAPEEVTLFKKDQEHFDQVKKNFNKWANYIRKLADTFDDEIIYGFGELLEKEQYNIQKSKRIFFLPLYSNEEDNRKLFKSLAEKVQSTESKDSNEDLYTFKKANIRRPSELDYSLSILGPNQEISNYAKDLLKNTFSLSLKQLERSRKDLIQLLSKTVKLQKKLQVNIHHPLLINESGSNIGLDISHNWNAYNSKIIKDIELASESILKAYKGCLKRIFKVYNEIQGRHKNFIIEVASMDDLDRSYIEVWNSLFDEILQLIRNYLNTFLHICPIESSRGDQYNYLFHLPQGGGEPDDELENDTIKQVESTGFRFIGDYETNTPISEIIPIQLEELKSQYILLQTEVTVVLNKSKTP